MQKTYSCHKLVPGSRSFLSWRQLSHLAAAEDLALLTLTLICTQPFSYTAGSRQTSGADFTAVTTWDQSLYFPHYVVPWKFRKWR